MLFENISILLADGKINHNMFVGIKNEKIVYLSSIKPKEKYNKIYNGTGKLMIPGFVNTHCHVPMTILRGVGNDKPLGEWLNNYIFPLENKLNSKDIYYGSLMGIGEMLKSGITSFSDMYYHCEEIAQAVIESGISANISHSVSVFDNKKDFKTLEMAEQIYKNFNGIDNNRLIVDMCLHSEYTTTPYAVEYIRNLSEKYNTSILLHLCETQKEVNECIKRHNVTPVKYFEGMGIFERNVIAAHCVYLTDEDIAILKKHNVNVAHCPISNLKLGSGIADIIKLKNSKINVTIGTDGTASNDNLNYLEDLKIAALLQKGLYKNPAVIKTGELLNMASINGAIAQRRYLTGEIKEGNFADIAILDCNSLNLSSCYDLSSGIIYSAIPENIILTMCRGKIVYENNSFKTIDMEKVIYECKKIIQKMA